MLRMCSDLQRKDVPKMWNRESKKGKYACSGRIWMIPTADILPNPEQPRREFRMESLLELAQSIGENGLIHPLTVAMRDGAPVLIAGERRLRAAKMAGLPELPCIVTQAEGPQAALLTLIENLQREDMNCFEEAAGIQRLIGVYGLTQEDAAQRLGCSQPTIANKLRLLKLPEDARQKMIAAGLTERHARALLRIDDEPSRGELLDRVIADRLTVAQTERLVEDLLAGRVKRRKPTPLVRDVRLFLNTVSHAVETMRRSGIEARAEKSETDEYIEYVVRIPKGSTRPAVMAGSRVRPA